MVVGWRNHHRLASTGISISQGQIGSLVYTVRQSVGQFLVDGSFYQSKFRLNYFTVYWLLWIILCSCRHFCSPLFCNPSSVLQIICPCHVHRLKLCIDTCNIAIACVWVEHTRCIFFFDHILSFQRFVLLFVWYWRLASHSGTVM